MAGIRPTEGQVAAAQLDAEGATRTADMELGLWAGTWTGELDVVYTEASARFTKIAALGLTEQSLPDSETVIAAEGSVTRVSWPEKTFTAGAGVSNLIVNGVYIATTIGGTKVIRNIERDPTQRTLNDGLFYAVTPNVLKS